MNLIDFLILLGFFLAFIDGWRRGLTALLFDVGSLALSVALAFLCAPVVGGWLGAWGLSSGLQPLVAFLVVLFAVDALLRWPVAFLVRRLPPTMADLPGGELAGAAVGVVKQAAVTAILLNLLLFLPVVPFVRNAVQRSALAPAFVASTGVAERWFAPIIEPAVKQLQEITTVTQITEEPVEIAFPVGDLVIDESAERAMLQLVNQERRTRGLPELRWNDELAEVGRIHSKDMWRRQYFSHINPDGLTPFDRIDAARIMYVAAGENLALAPTTPIAHQGLMNSPGHRANILSPDYGQVGIGAIRNGLYGIMYTQVFTN